MAASHNMVGRESLEPPSEREIFLAALEKENAAERAAFIDAACAGNRALRERIEELLGEEEKLGDFLETPALNETTHVAAATQSAPAATEKPGDRIGRYKLLQNIGEGGCGVVYMAEQEEPVRRRVALKIIKLGMDTRSVIARFEVERQALAMMDHPNIAKVFDGGATSTPLTRPPGTRSPTGGEGRGEGESAESQIANRKSQIPGGRPYFVMEL